MGLFLQQVVNGLTLGSIYCLVASGLTLIYGVMDIPNFAHGNLFMLGAYVTLAAVVFRGLSYFTGIIIAAAILALVGVAVERAVFHPLRTAPHLNMLIAAVGLMLFLEGFALSVWGPEYWRLPTPFGNVIRLAGLQLTLQRLLVIVIAASLIVLLHLFLKRTLIGATIEAMSQDREGAFLVGVNADSVSMLTFAIGSGLAAVAGALAGPVHLVYPAMGGLVTLKAFVIIVLGGMGSLPGAIVGGYVLGLAESLGGTYISMDYKDVLAFGLLVLIMTVRPTGLFSAETR